MTREQIIDKWANHLAGKWARFAFAEIPGPGLEGRLRSIVHDIEYAVGKIIDESASLHQPVAIKPSSNGHTTPLPAPRKA